MRDVILGAMVVIFVSLAVPAWILRVEYRKTHSAGATLVPTADVLRERMSPVTITPRPPRILELAERIVRQEAERRAAERRAAVQPPARAPLPPPVTRPVPAVPADPLVESPPPIDLQQGP